MECILGIGIVRTVELPGIRAKSGVQMEKIVRFFLICVTVGYILFMVFVWVPLVGIQGILFVTKHFG